MRRVLATRWSDAARAAALVLAGATAAGAVAPAAKLLAVAVSGGATPEVRLRLSRGVQPTVKELPAEPGRPARVYVDLPGTALLPTVPRQITGRGPLLAVRTGQFDSGTARVVVDLRGATHLAVTRHGSTVALRPAARVAAPAAEPAAAPAASPSGEQAAAAPPSATPDRTDALSPLERAVESAAAASDMTEVVALYAGDPAAIERHGSPATRAAVADALRALGLLDAAARVLGDDAANEPPPLHLARAELALAAGDPAGARVLLAPLDESRISAAQAERLRRVRARVALADGHTDPASLASPVQDVELARDAARAALAAAQAAERTRSWPLAAAAYRRVAAADVDGALRAAATSGLARAALASGDRSEATRALRDMATLGDPLLRRAATTLAGTRGIQLEAPAREPAQPPAEEPWP